MLADFKRGRLTEFQVQDGSAKGTIIYVLCYHETGQLQPCSARFKRNTSKQINKNTTSTLDYQMAERDFGDLHLQRQKYGSHATSLLDESK
jgi:hypothetical protein